MQSDATRAAFTLSLIYQRRDERRMTAVAVLQSGLRVFLGLDNGVLEEHRCVPASAAGALPPAVAAAAGGMLLLRLLAEKKVFGKAAVAAICPVEAAARLVCMSDEGQVRLLGLLLLSQRTSVCVRPQALCSAWDRRLIRLKKMC
jgi:hypothetical protein